MLGGRGIGPAGSATASSISFGEDLDSELGIRSEDFRRFEAFQIPDGSFATFSDPDGNGYLLQEVSTRLPGRIDSAETSYVSVNDLMNALLCAARAHGEHEKRAGQELPT
jgi:hypothetical protein